MAVNLVDKNGAFVGVHYGEASKTLAANDIDLSHELFGRAKAVYFGGTAKQPRLFPDCEGLFRQLSERNLKVFYDPNRFPAAEVLTDRSLVQAQLAYVEGYFPNDEELLQASGMESTDEALDWAIGCGVGFVALKRGARGCRIKTRDDDFEVAGHEVEVVTTVGAGDCFNATFMAHYLQGSTLQACAEAATAAAAIKVSQNVWPDMTAVNNLLQR